MMEDLPASAVGSAIRSHLYDLPRSCEARKEITADDESSGVQMEDVLVDIIEF